MGDLETGCPDLWEWRGREEIRYCDLYRGLKAYCESFQAPVNLCGLSLGGILALQYCLEYPEKVNALALIGTQYVMPKRMLQIQNLLFRVMPNSAFREMGLGKRDVISLCKSMMALDFHRELPGIHCPVEVICGETDRANIAACVQLADQIPQAHLSVIAGAGHEVNTDQPEALGEALAAFFAQEAG